MNIKITHNWLLEYLETDADPYEIQKYLSLCGPSVERVTKVDGDYVYDIEITSNRVDMASVFGFAQEAQAILPQFGKKAKLKFNPLKSYTFSSIETSSELKERLNIEIKNKNLCSRFTAIVLDNVKIGASPNFIRDRLNLCDIKSINNVVDISNYLMLALGQPVHVFDYDSIGRERSRPFPTMILRESKKEEKIITLDGKQLTLPGGDIVIEDGDAKLIDLCGIMGGFNSAVNPKTNKVILFVQTYDSQKIRKTSMLTGQRTVAATYFEKVLDEERVEPTTVYGVELLQKYAGATIASQLYDIYPNPLKPKKVSILINDVQRIIGISLKKDIIIKILSNLGFIYHLGPPGTKMVFEVPSYRGRDVSIKEDLIEEIARIYGYHNLPNNIQPTVYVKQPKEVEQLFELQSKVKHFLKHLGLNEVMNYSMISKQMIDNSELRVEDHLELKNTISDEIRYMRSYLLPSLFVNIKNNEGKVKEVKFFEIAKTYKPQENNLPKEEYKLGIVINTSLTDLKGLIDALIVELNITNYVIKNTSYPFLSKNMQGEMFVEKDWIVKYGEISSQHKSNYQIRGNVYIAVFDFKTLIKYQKLLSSYNPINPFATIKLDLTMEFSSKKTFWDIKKLAFETSKLLQKIEVESVFKNKITLRFYFSSPERNLTEEEAKKELTNIRNKL
ncbi:phenylalanine--tRNA ligase subunit beta [Candidatus Roizmanbacteria bacterium RIFCSPHIGHO2_12_FULL_37_9b]|uniref:phenylalanine--tRNA ligase n=1 Tax=Candidatus Roizmanbacteria bacterium RIFCSPHIGHO2_02_FULL_38_11 TaxID=1802039 RepID=A0A1F7H3L5_9BACT|nr:MAG: phenylalanine--tRNA ligase subunit beta [Candidatus Roizmanbacteria bacterium RIFCSPHIGHO2_02_FULL_38_11]OGK35145.1 MAG: phenylalanine--tRNA ligase subunit beta [Candidatus Roizmanbacteria bacterium RIFCSPHIGHO2_12_FULL_37_9b]